MTGRKEEYDRLARVAIISLPSGPGFLEYAELCWWSGEAVTDISVRQAQVAGTRVLSIVWVHEVDAAH